MFLSSPSYFTFYIYNKVYPHEAYNRKIPPLLRTMGFFVLLSNVAA